MCAVPHSAEGADRPIIAAISFRDSSAIFPAYGFKLLTTYSRAFGPVIASHLSMANLMIVGGKGWKTSAPEQSMDAPRIIRLVAIAALIVIAIAGWAPRPMPFGHKLERSCGTASIAAVNSTGEKQTSSSVPPVLLRTVPYNPYFVEPNEGGRLGTAQTVR